MCTWMALVALWCAHVLWGKSFFIGETTKSTKFSFGKHFIVSQILVYDNIACDSSAVWQLNVCSIIIAVECTPYRHKVVCIILFSPSYTRRTNIPLHKTLSRLCYLYNLGYKVVDQVDKYCSVHDVYFSRSVARTQCSELARGNVETWMICTSLAE